MKKTKIILSASAVLAVVCSALAFTPKTFSTFCVYQVTGDACPLVATSDDASIISPIGGDAYVIPRIGDCPPAVNPTLCVEQVVFEVE